MKRLLALLLALTLMLSLVACGTAPETETEEEVSTETQSENKNDKNDKNNKNDKKKVTFTELVAVDNEECLIKITGITEDEIWGYTLKAQLENKSADKTYMFSLQNASINGVQCTSLFAEEVAAGKKANGKIYFSDEALEENDIGNYTDIELTFRVYDSDDWSADDVALETVHVYPYGEDEATKFVRKAKATDNVILDNEYVTAIVTGYEEDEIWGYTVNLFLLNKTDKEVMFSTDNDSVNGYMIDPYFSATVSPGKCSFESISWSDDEFEENDITTVEEIEFDLVVRDYNNWTSDGLAKETITLNP